MAEKKLSKKALNKSFRNWFYGHLTCFSQEHMQTFGYLCAMLPLVEELYDTKEEQTEALKTYSAFFNTEPQLGTVIVGMTAGLEEAKANGEDIDGEMINGIRAGLMGPVAGIGDSLLVGTLIPILLGVALGMSSGGSPLGAIFYIIAYNVILTLGMRLLYFKGYELGGKAVEMIVGEKANAIRESIIMLGTVVIGAVAASWISITTPLVLPGDISLQKDVLDTIFPKMLPLATVMLCYWLMSKKKMAPTTVMLVLVGIALVGVLVQGEGSSIAPHRGQLGVALEDGSFYIFGIGELKNADGMGTVDCKQLFPDENTPEKDKNFGKIVDMIYKIGRGEDYMSFAF